MIRYIFFRAVLGSSIGALTASGFYSVIYALMHQGGSGLLPGAMVIAGTSYGIFFLLEFTFWSALRKIQGKATLLS